MTKARGGILEREILAQPAVLERFRAREGARVIALGQALGARRPRGVLIAARGSSDHAAVYAKYLFGERLRLPVALAAPSLVTRYGVMPSLADWLVLGISQSGSSPDIVAVLEAAGSQGCFTLAITNTPGSSLARAAHEVVDLRVGEEHGVAATGTFTATLYALAHLACGAAETRSAELDGVPGSVASTLDQGRRSADLARSLEDSDAAVVLGRGYAFPVALEWSLKLKEVAGLWAEPFSAADYRHGPIALARPGLVAFLVDPRGPGRVDLEALRAELVRRGVRTVRAGDDSEADLRFPEGPEWLAPIPAVVAGQLLALHLAHARARNPDRPPGLTKVTRTL